MSNLSPSLGHRSREARVFAEKAARSIIEIQKNTNNVADIAILLEVAGITIEDLEQHGFKDVYDLAVYIHEFIDFYEAKEEGEAEFTSAFLVKIPSKTSRLMETLALTFPWTGALALLALSGVSLWLASALPLETVTALLIGLFLGIFITEGPMEVFQRYLILNHSQMNMSEAKRTIGRNFGMICVLAASSAGLLLGVGYSLGIPAIPVLVAVVALVTISFHRASYLLLYSLKKLKHLVLSYSVALALVPLVYYSAPRILPDVSTRYLVALAAAFVSLSVSAIYAHHKVFKGTLARGDHPHFYRATSAIKKTIRARVRIQLREALPYYVFTTFFFAMMFGDRVVSWLFSPALRAGAGYPPLMFNTLYHRGADPATLVFFVTSLVQYVIMAPIYHEVTNASVVHGVTEMGRVDGMLRSKYKHLILASVVTSGCVAAILNLMGPALMVGLASPEVSLRVLEVASMGNVFLSIFIADSMFATFVNRMKPFAVLAVLATAVLGLAGFALGRTGFENIVYAYLAAALLAATLGSVYVIRLLRNASSIFFARFA